MPDLPCSSPLSQSSLTVRSDTKEVVSPPLSPKEQERVHHVPTSVMVMMSPVEKGKSSP